LLIGQSNMAGRGPLDAVPPITHPDVYMFREDAWRVAAEPLHNDKPTIAGVGLGMTCALDLLREPPGTPVGLVPCAVGGTPLSRWMPGADLYTQAVQTARHALASGRLVGILWHQGEADSQWQETADTYGARLAEMVASLRSELDARDVPFVAGELGEFLTNYEACRERFEIVNRQIEGAGARIQRFGFARSTGLKDKGDSLHFGSEALREFGRRYAAELIRLLRAASA